MFLDPVSIRVNPPPIYFFTRSPTLQLPSQRWLRFPPARLYFPMTLRPIPPREKTSTRPQSIRPPGQKPAQYLHLAAIHPSTSLAAQSPPAQSDFQDMQRPPAI